MLRLVTSLLDPGAWTHRQVMDFCRTAYVVPRGCPTLPESMGRWNRDSVREVGVVTGCLAVVARDLRLRLLGYRPAITPEAEVVHAGGASALTRGEKRVHVLRSKVTLDWLYAPRWQDGSRVLLVALGMALRASAEHGGPVGEGGWLVAWRRRAEWLWGYA